MPLEIALSHLAEKGSKDASVNNNRSSKAGKYLFDDTQNVVHFYLFVETICVLLSPIDFGILSVKSRPWIF